MLCRRSLEWQSFRLCVEVQGAALAKCLDKTVCALQEKSPFWNRKTAVKKVHMLLLAYLGRREIPDSLENDLKFVLKKAPIFLEEIVKIAQIPHHAQQMWGWYEPTKAAIQMCQCVVQAVSTDIRKGGGAKTKVCRHCSSCASSVYKRLVHQYYKFKGRNKWPL